MNRYTQSTLILLMGSLLLLVGGCVVSVEESYHPCDECYYDEECIFDSYYDEYLCVEVHGHYLTPEESAADETEEPEGAPTEHESKPLADEGDNHE